MSCTDIHERALDCACSVFRRLGLLRDRHSAATLVVQGTRTDSHASSSEVVSHCAARRQVASSATSHLFGFRVDNGLTPARYMSTPDFAPGITSVLPTDLKHFASSTSHPGVTPSTRSSGVAVSLRSTSSSSPSSSSTGSQSSPATSSLASSSILGGAASSLSMTTASSPGSANGGHAGRTQDYGGSVDSEKSESGRMEDDDAAGMPSAGTRERQRSDSGSRELAELSMQESTTEPTAPMRVDTTMTGSSSGTAHGTKTRRASTISSSGSSSNSHHQPFATTEEAGWWAVPGAGTKGGREGQPARRKAPRMGSFEGSQSSTQTQAPTPQQMKADAPEQQAQGGPRDGGDSRRGSVSAASASRHAPPVVPNNTRPPVPGSAFPSSSISAAHPAPASSSSTPRPAQQHVDIVSYPSPDLLRLLASLLEQIAHANDSLHQRASQSRSGSTSPADARTGEGSSHYSMETQQSFSQGRFDAAPLNSPSTPRYRRGSIESDLAAASAAANSHAEVSAPTEMPVTPGVDLLREVGGNSGVEGFMPSLGGNHVPQPLARRRGSSFLRNRERDEAAALSSSFGKSGSTPAGTGTSALADKPDPGPAAAIISSAATGSATSGGTTTPPNTAPGQATEPPLASLLTASSQALASPSATLCFHARNVPAISIEAYLLRILKYCPTTNEVFLSLLVYFDRMARVGLEAQKGGAGAAGAGARTGGSRGGGAARERARSGGELDTRPFAIDSFNVHRLVIAGVTVASKFFSDVFYTNSRYAKVTFRLVEAQLRSPLGRLIHCFGMTGRRPAPQ